MPILKGIWDGGPTERHLTEKILMGTIVKIIAVGLQNRNKTIIGIYRRITLLEFLGFTGENSKRAGSLVGRWMGKLSIFIMGRTFLRLAAEEKPGTFKCNLASTEVKEKS
jgi:hypothetical protein